MPAAAAPLAVMTVASCGAQALAWAEGVCWKEGFCDSLSQVCADLEAKRPGLELVSRDVLEVSDRPLGSCLSPWTHPSPRVKQALSRNI